MKHLFDFMQCSLAVIVVSSPFLVQRALAQDDDSMCTDTRTGVPAYNFFKGLTTWSEKTVDGQDDAWVYSDKAGPGETGYVYLDDKASNELPRMIQAQISEVDAICVEFSYALSGPSNEPIRFYLIDGTQYSLMHEVVPTQGDGTWLSTNFSCCLPNPQSEVIKLSLEATSRKDAIVSIDYIDIRLSNMSCSKDSGLVCYPTPPTLEPPKQTTFSATPQSEITSEAPPASQSDNATGEEYTTKETITTNTIAGPTCTREIEQGIASCDFFNNETELETCGWTQNATGGWDFETDYDGDRFIYSLDGGREVLVSPIDEDVSSACITIKFAAGNETDEISGLYNIYLSNGTIRYLWAASHEYTNESSTVWTENLHKGCLGTGPYRTLTIEPSSPGVKFSYIRVLRSEGGCPDDEIATTQGSKSTATIPAVTDTVTVENPLLTEKPINAPSTEKSNNVPPTAETDSKTGLDSTSASLNVAAIVCSVVAALVIISIVIGGLWYWNKYRRGGSDVTLELKAEFED